MRLRRTGTIHIREPGPMVVLVADALAASNWNGLLGGVYNHANLQDEPGALIEWDGNHGLLGNLGRPLTVAIIEIYRPEPDVVVGAIDWGSRAGDVARLPPTVTTILGEVEIASGALAILSAPEPPVGLSPARLLSVQAKGAARFDWGVVLRTPPGAYRVALETVSRPSDGSRDGERRLRVSPSATG